MSAKHGFPKAKVLHSPVEHGVPYARLPGPVGREPPNMKYHYPLHFPPYQE